MIRIGNTCISSSSCILILALILFGTIALASIYNSPKALLDTEPQEVEGIWIPTEEDIRYQDSMYIIIRNTQNDVTDIKEDIVYILERLDYADGTWDSIRYVKGGKIDKRRNK